MNLRPLCCAAAVALLPACFGPRTSIVSNKAPTAVLAPKRVFVISHLVDRRAGLNWGDEFAQAFEARAAEGLKRCGAEVAAYRVSGIETDSGEALVRQVKDFKPDSLLKVQKTHGLAAAGGGVLLNADYDVTLLQDAPAPAAGAKAKDDEKDKTKDKAKAKDKDALKTAWRASVSFKPSDHSFGVRTFTQDAQSFADEILGKLLADGFFPGCPPAPKPPPASGT